MFSEPMALEEDMGNIIYFLNFKNEINLCEHSETQHGNDLTIVFSVVDTLL